MSIEGNRLVSCISKLVAFWERQGIVSNGIDRSQILAKEESLGFKIPEDLKLLYEQVNGMERLYPNYLDEYGFLFYPLENLEIIKLKSDSFGPDITFECLCFANYLHRSWSYGVVGNHTASSGYSILLIGSQFDYRVLSNDLQDFLEKYLVDDSAIY